MKYIIGIDLGTTNSVVSVYRKGRTETLKVEGALTMPSVVSFRDEKTMLVGTSAKKRLILDPEHSIGSVKRFMGNRKKRFSIFGNEYTPVDISSFILRKLVDEAEKTLEGKIDDVIITVPAYFTDAQKADTKLAGEKAGLNVIRLIPEPTAAAISYGLDKGKDQTILVYDLGGGTFDVSILKVEKNDFSVLAVDGDAQLGGDDFDNAIVKFCCIKFKEKTGIDLDGDNSREGLIAKQKLKEAAERAKCELSEAQSTEIMIPEIMGKSIEEKITLELYNELIKKLIDKTIEKIMAVLNDAGKTAADIDRVILVGGSTRNRLVKDVVTSQLKEPYVTEKVDEAVSHGASILAASMSTPEEDFQPIEINMINKTAHSLGVEILNEKNIPRFTPIIRKNSDYPTDKGIIASTIHPFQGEVFLQVFRGEHEDCTRNEKLGELVLKIKNLSKDTVPIGAIFELDENGIIHFSCVELPINIGERAIMEVVQDAAHNNCMLDIGKVKKLMDRGIVTYIKTEVKVQ